MLDVILDTLLDFLKLLPFLFFTYLLMEWMEHKMGDKTRRALEAAGPFAPLLGGAVGAVPQCGFSATASGLYAGRVLSIGTLFAVYLSTSDELLPIVLSHAADGTFAPWSVLRILAGKAVIGILFGVILDLVIRFLPKKHKEEPGEHGHIHALCAHDHCGCERGIFRSALHHTVEIGGFLLLITFALNTLIFLVGEDALAAFLRDKGALAYLFSALVGLIPNCAASVVVTELYLSGALTVGALYAGSLTGAGVGVLVLFRVNRPMWQNFLILLGLFSVGVVAGSLIDLFGFSFLGLRFA